MKRKNTGNGIIPSKDGKSAIMLCGQGEGVKVRYVDLKKPRKDSRKPPMT